VRKVTKGGGEGKEEKKGGGKIALISVRGGHWLGKETVS